MDHHASSRQRTAQFRLKPVTLAESQAASGDGKNGKLTHPPRALPEQRRKYLRDYARWLWPFRWALSGVFLMAAIAAGLDAIWPLLIRQAINLPTTQLAPDEKLRQLGFLGIGTCLLLLIKQAIDTFRGYRMAVLN